MTKFINSEPFGVVSPGTTNNYRDNWELSLLGGNKPDCTGCFKKATRSVTLAYNVEAPVCQHCYDRYKDEQKAFEEAPKENPVERIFLNRIKEQHLFNTESTDGE
jgi:hypothetical protein